MGAYVLGLESGRYALCCPAAGFVSVKADVHGLNAGLFEQAHMIRCKAVCAVAWDGVFDTCIDQCETVDDRLGKDDLLMRFSGLAVKQAVSFAR